MTQATPIIGASQSGLQYRNADNDGKKALLNHHKGSAAPGYAEAGMIWLDDTATPWIMKIYDGTDWIGLGTVNASTNLYVPYNTSIWAGTSGGTANAQTLTPAQALGAYVAGVQHEFLVSASNTSGTVTLAVSGLATRNIKKFGGGSVCALAVGDLVVNTIAQVVDDGTQYLLLNPATHAQGADVASSTTTNLDTATGDYVNITGTTAITGIILAQGREVTVQFSGALTFTNGASLILPGGANITTAAGDCAVLRGEASGVVRCIVYTAKASKAPLLTVGTAASNLVQLNGSAQLPAVSGALLTNLPSASPLVLLATATASASATLDFTSVITSAYSAYKIIIRDLVTSANADFDVRISADNGSTWTMGFNWQKTQINIGSNTVPSYGGGGTPAIIGGQYSSTGSLNGVFDFIAETSASGHALFTGTVSDDYTVYRTDAMQAGAFSIVDAIRFHPSTGNFTSGKIYIYGLKNT